ncbi:MAG TPA: NAD-dependent epimerase/dehydratase family protein [Solirubrobacteraceae bacterium]|nr:NAD-dependent epimerase/dehydratase family protein [Solirubrobacteraceae bacterium]
MSRVLVTGGTGTIGAEVVRRLLADPAYDVRVADRKDAPQWMREGCEIRTGDLREHEQAASAVRGCDRVVHLACPSEDAAAEYSLITASAALDSAILRAAIDQRVQRFLYVSCARCARESKQTGVAAADQARPSDGSALLPARDFAKLLGERLCQAAQTEHGLPFAICRLSLSREHVGQAAEEILAALP